MIKHSEGQVSEYAFAPVKSLIGAVKGTVTAYIFLVICFCILALVYTYTPMPDKYVETAVNGISVVSLLVAGFVSSRSADMLGWLHGALAGFMHSVIRILLGLMVFKSYVPSDGVVKLLLIAILTAAIGGIAGINFGKNKRRRSKKASR